MSYLDIQCPNCGEFHYTGSHRTKICPTCGSNEIIVLPHDWDTDARFRQERENMLARGDED